MKVRSSIVFILSILFLSIPIFASGQHEETSNTASEAYPTLHIIGFTDIDFFASDEPDTPAAPSKGGFFEGQFVLHFTSRLSSKFSFISEVSLTARKDAATNAGVAGFNAEVERTILKYNYNDRFKISLGRYHTPINYWNTAYHHGQWLQTSISRPEMTRFGGQFIPVHFVGVLLEGLIPAAGVNLNYNVGVGNGRSSIISRAGDAVDVNDHRAWLAGAFIKPDRLYDLQIGGAFYNDNIAVGDLDYKELISSTHIAWTKETPEVIVEYAWIRHRDDVTDQVLHNHAYYLQIGYRLSAFRDKMKPYYRWEDSRIDPDDQVFSNAALHNGSTFGLRCELSELVAAKLEYRRQHFEHQSSINSFFSQISFTF